MKRWQAMSRAPRDGSTIIGWFGDRCIIVFWRSGPEWLKRMGRHPRQTGNTVWYWSDGYSRYPEPECWQPEPEPPAPARPAVRRTADNGWSRAEITILREKYPAIGTALTALLPRRNTHAIRQMANKLGIRRGRGLRPPKPTLLQAQSAARIAKEPRTFAEQLALVESGQARIVEVTPIRMPPPDRTLGGVTAEMI